MANRLPSVEWILPQAPLRPVSLNHGCLRPSWFDMRALPPSHLDWDHVGTAASINWIESIVQAEMLAGADPRRIILVGFSQGAALSLVVALSSLVDFGGIACLSGWLPHGARQQIVAMHTDTNVPIFWGHGLTDHEIPICYAEESVSFLRDVLRLSPLTLQRYNGLQHSVNAQELEELVNWIAHTLRLPRPL